MNKFNKHHYDSREKLADKEAQRKIDKIKIENDIEEFLKSGNKIKIIPCGVSGKKIHYTMPK